MSKLVGIPPSRHACGIGFETRELPPDHPLRAHGLTTYAALVHERDPVGTVRACDTCGKTWVAYRPHQDWALNSWRPEGRIARWLRVRRGRR